MSTSALTGFPSKSHPGKCKSHPYRKRFHLERIGPKPKSLPAKNKLSALTLPDSRSERTKEEISHWFRVVVFERIFSTDRTYQIGTLYGRDPEILSVQVSGLLRRKWHVYTSAAMERCPTGHLLSCVPDKTRELSLHFEVPGNTSHRSIGQMFGAFQRKLYLELDVANKQIKDDL